MYGPLKPVSACFVAKNRHVDYFIKNKKKKIKKMLFQFRAFSTGRTCCTYKKLGLSLS